jgi:Transglycosylase SLT domain
MTIDRTRLGLSTIPDKIIGYDIVAADDDYNDGHYSSAIYHLAPICNKARKVGKEHLLPEKVLKQYYPLPKKYYSYVIANLPAEIKALPPKDIEEFIHSFFAYVHRESKFDAKLVNHNSHASGLTQLLPSTADGVAKELSIEHYDLLNPYDNLLIGMNYFKQLWLGSGGFVNRTTIMSDWNYGPTKTKELMRHHKGQPLIKALDNVPETKLFVQEVNHNYSMYKKLYGKTVHYLAFAVSMKRPIKHQGVPAEHRPLIQVVKPAKNTVMVQVGAFHIKDNAEKCREAHPGAVIETIIVCGKELFRVKVALKKKNS